MRIPEFIDLIVAEYDNKLKTKSQIDAFEMNCKAHLKKYEGEILGFAYNEFVYQNQSRTSPTVGKIIKLCNSKMTTDHKSSNPMSRERAEWIANQKIFDDYKTTDKFKWACQNMIGWDVELFISRNGVGPEKPDIQRMMKAHEEFKKSQAYMENDIDLSTSRLAIYKMGKELNQKNLNYYHAHIE